MINLHFHVDADLTELLCKLDRVLALEEKMALDLTDLITQATAIKSASDSATTLIEALAAKYEDAIRGAADLNEARAKIAEISASLRTEAGELGDAVAANTPAEEPTPAKPA